MGNTARFGYAIQVFPSDKTLISKHKIQSKKNFLIPIQKINKLLNHIFHRTFVDKMYNIFVAPFLSLVLVLFLCQLNVVCQFLS